MGPPGVVVAEGHIGRVGPPYREVAAEGAGVPAGPQYADRRRMVSQGSEGRVVGAVVDDDDRGPFGEGGEGVDSPQDAGGPVSGDDRDRDPAVLGAGTRGR